MKIPFTLCMPLFITDFSIAICYVFHLHCRFPCREYSLHPASLRLSSCVLPHVENHGDNYLHALGRDSGNLVWNCLAALGLVGWLMDCVSGPQAQQIKHSLFCTMLSSYIRDKTNKWF
jgi:hypothetical protein